MHSSSTVLQKLRRDRLSSYRHSPQDIEAHFREEGQIQSDYHRRFVYELIQNADDALGDSSDETPRRRVRFELRGDALIVANNGRPIDNADVCALCTMSYTTKSARDDRRASIGHKGKGFSSVMEITDNPQVYSTEHSFEFDRQKSRAEIEKLLEELDDPPHISGIPLMRLPFEPHATPAAVEALFDEGFETVFYFPLSVDENPGLRKDVARTLQVLDANTIVFLRHLDELEIRVNDQHIDWSVARGEAEKGQSSEHQIVHVEASRYGADSESTEQHTFALFTRRDIEIGEHTGGISKNTWGEVKFTEVAIATAAQECGTEWALIPFDKRPNIHVFLPTEERCPFPLLINGAFHSTISRTRIEVDDDPRHYNSFLLSQVADLLATDVRDFAARAGDWKAFIGCLATKAGSDDEVEVSLQTRLVEGVRKSFQDVPFVPVAGSTQPVTLDDVLLPYYSSDQRSLATTLCELVGERAVALPGYSRRRLLTRELLTKRHVRTLRALGALQMRSDHVPGVLASLPAEHTKIRRTRTDGELSGDPVLEVLLATWKTINADDDLADEFRRACREHALFPVGHARGFGMVQRVAKGDDVFFFPPEAELPDIELSGMRFLCRELYRPRKPVASQEQRDLVSELQPALEAIWDVRKFQFDEVLNAAVRPKISGGDTDRADELRNVDVLRLLARLAEHSIDGTSLPYTERKKRPVVFALAQLPLPTRRGAWKPAYTLYFGDDWFDDDTPIARRVEPLADKADLGLDFLAAPEAFRAEDSEELELLERFLCWLGVSCHLRLRTLFSPAVDQRIKRTKGLKAPSSTHLAELDASEHDAYLEYVRDELARRNPKERSYLYRVHALDQADALMAAASADLEIGEMLLEHLSAWWEDFYSRFTRTVVGTMDSGSLSRRKTWVFGASEKRKVGLDLWLWRLRRTPWCPTSLGNQRPEACWLSQPDLLRRFALDSAAGPSPLLPVIEAETPTDLQSALGVRSQLNSKTFSRDDAAVVCQSLERAYRGAPKQRVGADLSRIRPKYRFISKLLPTAGGDDARTDAQHCVPILCRTDDSKLRFVPSDEAFFVRSPDVRARLCARRTPIFVLESDEAINFAAHFGVHDLERCLDAKISIESELAAETSALERRLREVAPFILCRLEADRRTPKLKSQDATNLANFIEEVTVVEGLSVEYLPRDGLDLPPIELGEASRPGYVLDASDSRRSRRRLPLVDYRAPEDGGIDEYVASALCEFMNVQQFEGVFSLLSSAKTLSDKKRFLRLAGAPWEDEEIESKRRELNGSDALERSFDEVALDPQMNAWETRAKVQPHAQDTTNAEPQRRTHSLIDPDTLIFEDGQIVESREPAPSDKQHSHRGTGGAGQRTASGANAVGPSQEYVDEVDYIGTKLAVRYEYQRLERTFGCNEPEAYVFPIHNPRRVREARQDIVASRCLNELERRGVPLPYPGFDLLTIRPDTGGIDRLIELKSSGLAVRKVEVTWNEWKTARNQEVREHYYLYVVGGLRSETSARPFLREIRNPFEVLRKREEKEREQKQRQVQLDLRYFTADAGAVKEAGMRPSHNREAVSTTTDSSSVGRSAEPVE